MLGLSIFYMLIGLGWALYSEYSWQKLRTVLLEMLFFVVMAIFWPVVALARWVDRRHWRKADPNFKPRKFG